LYLSLNLTSVHSSLDGNKRGRPGGPPLPRTEPKLSP
jgi:hypothetical protein